MARYARWFLIAFVSCLIEDPIYAQTTVWTAPEATPPPATHEGEGGPILSPGDEARVNWQGQWYAATILKADNGLYLVHYDGWSSAWDEWVDAVRVRLPDGSLVGAPPREPEQDLVAPSAPSRTVDEISHHEDPPSPEEVDATGEEAGEASSGTVWSHAPEGRYVCRTWDYGQVGRVGEFVLETGGTYRDLHFGGDGHYRYDPETGSLAFTSGPQQTDTATIHFDADAHEGKGFIVFDYGGGATLHCYRESLK